MMEEELKKALKPCPFCGGTDFLIELGCNGKIVNQQADNASLKCIGCGVQYQHIYKISEHFEVVDEKKSLYRKIPEKYAEEVLLEKWNRRTMT